MPNESNQLQDRNPLADAISTTLTRDQRIAALEEQVRALATTCTVLIDESIAQKQMIVKLLYGYEELAKMTIGSGIKAQTLIVPDNYR